MRTLSINEAHTSEEIKKFIGSIKGYNDVVDWKIILAAKENPGMEATTIASVLCISVHKVYKVIEQYNKMGIYYKQNKPWGGRRSETSYLTLEEEKEILRTILEKAGKGLIITAKAAKEEFEKKIGRQVSDDYMWDVFKRHNWNKKSPRPQHPKSDKDRQEDFKKNSQKTWQPPD